MLAEHILRTPAISTKVKGLSQLVSVRFPQKSYIKSVFSVRRSPEEEYPAKSGSQCDEIVALD